LGGIERRVESIGRRKEGRETERRLLMSELPF